MYDNRPIGVLDSGVGGLTVAKELRDILPKENIIYFGDNANVPYGNKSEEEIYQLTKKMIDFLISKNAKLIAIACNTISSILDKYFQDYGLDIIGIIEPAADYVIKNKIQKVGVIATNFTIESGAHESLIKKHNKKLEVVTEASPSLASVIDGGDFTDEEIRRLVDLHMTSILKKDNLKEIILGCTHYPIVIDIFQERSPGINFINPAYEQVIHIRDLMEAKKISGNNDKASFQVFTTGKASTYEKMVNLISIEKPSKINILDVDF